MFEDEDDLLDMFLPDDALVPSILPNHDDFALNMMDPEEYWFEDKIVTDNNKRLKLGRPINQQPINENQTYHHTANGYDALMNNIDKQDKSNKNIPSFNEVLNIIGPEPVLKDELVSDSGSSNGLLHDAHFGSLFSSEYPGKMNSLNSRMALPLVGYPQNHFSNKPVGNFEFMQTEQNVEKRNSKTKMYNSKLDFQKLSIREKNRKAVRECRQRKREAASRLKNRIEDLKQQNEKLKFQLNLGTDKVIAELDEIENKIIQNISKALSKDQSPEVDQELKVYVKQFIDQRKSLRKDSEEALFFLLSRMQTQAMPNNVTKMYFWQNAQKDDYFKATDGLWSVMLDKLDMNDSQSQMLRSRRESVMLTCASLANAIYQVRKVGVIARQKYNKYVESYTLHLLDEILTARQMANLLVYFKCPPVELNLRLEKGFNLLLRKCDPEINLEIKNGSHEYKIEVDSKIFSDRIKSVDHNENRLSQLLMKRRNKAMQIKSLFLAAKDGNIIQHVVGEIFAENIELFDPNFKEPVVGRERVSLFFYKLIRGFENLSAKNTEFSLRKKSSIAKSIWILSGEYVGKTLDLDQDAATSDNESISTPKRRVEFKMIVGFKFKRDEDSITQVVLSWAALDLVQQLGLLSDSVVKSNPFKKSKLSVTPHMTVNKLRELCTEFCKIFSNPEKFIGTSILDENILVKDTNMGGRFKGIKETQKYAVGIRKPFTEMEFSNFSYRPFKSQKKVKRFFKRHCVKFLVCCTVNGVYAGKLVKKPKPFSMTAEMFFEVNSVSKRISEAVLYWNASLLMSQLGVIQF